VTGRRPKQGIPQRQAAAIAGAKLPPRTRFVLSGDLLVRLDVIGRADIGLLAVLAAGQLVAVAGFLVAGIRAGMRAVFIGLAVAVRLAGLMLAIFGIVLVAVVLVVSVLAAAILVVAPLAVMVVAIVVAVTMALTTLMVAGVATIVIALTAVAPVVFATLPVGAAMTSIPAITTAVAAAAVVAAAAFTTATAAAIAVSALGVGCAQCEVHEIARGGQVPWREHGAHCERCPSRGADEALLAAQSGHADLLCCNPPKSGRWHFRECALNEA
jgi:hypothetical protein